jgi:transposase InsO family protein
VGPHPAHARRAAPWPAIAGTPCPGHATGWSAAHRSATIAFGSPATAPSVSAQNDIWSERFNRTLLDEWAYTRPYTSNNERLLALPDFVNHYNNHRPHTALKGLTPMAVLVNNVSGNHT